LERDSDPLGERESGITRSSGENHYKGLSIRTALVGRDRRAR
jgi:hypothetical protein